MFLQTAEKGSRATGVIPLLPERARSECARSMRAVKPGLATPDEDQGGGGEDSAKNVV